MSVQFVVVAESSPAALIDDAHRLVAEYAALPHVAGRWLTIDADLTALPHPFTAPHGLLLIARVDDLPVAVGGLVQWAPGIGELKRIYVQPTARGRGIGERVTTELIAHATRLGYQSVRLDTAPELTAARALYERLGFQPIAQYRKGLLRDTLCFELRLRPDTDLSISFSRPTL
jgi:ribosomal protein S18 acetylase RimI-like enzyme